ncbi:MAG TPA: ATP-binding protein [Solirubrobacteraceae bacterium]|nr:ATP-binding protein [Solirubrobacteraceae bacterium]
MIVAGLRLAAALPRGDTLPDDGFRRRHRLMLQVLVAHALVLPLLALAYGASVLHALLEGGVVAALAAAAATAPAGRRVRALLAAAGLLTCSAVLVHITDGLIEAHFHFFVAVAMLSLYEDWAVYGLAVSFVLLHHGLGTTAFGQDVYAHDGRAWTWAGVHTFFIGWLCVAHVVVWRSSERARRQLQDAHAELERRAAALERSNGELQQFAYVASHDLSEPLRMVTGYMQLLQRRYEGQLDDDADQFIGFAVEGAGRMRALIDDLLRYSRLEHAAIEARPVDARETVDATLRSLAASLEDAGADVRVQGLPVVAADPVQLGQLFQNLIANALKFRNGSAPQVEVLAERDPDGWRFTVADNGLGIDPDHADRVFKMFQRLHGRDEYDGNGIGLAICRKIVDRHGGRIWVEPNPGGGSRFVFTLPDAAAAAPGTPPG